MKNIKLKVHWFQERVDVKDDNNGYHWGIYTYDCTEDDYEPEAGYGSYDILDVEWFKTKAEREMAFLE